jgi:hypothetical protein
MALNDRARGRVWSRLHFLIRLAGLSGLFVGIIGLVLMAVEGREHWLEVALAGGVAALIALLVEIQAAVRLVAGRRGAFGVNVAFQVALATLLLVGLNLISFSHYVRFDWTFDHRFTLPKDIRAQMARLRGDKETTIVVYQRHKAFGQSSDKPDVYDFAAERKVVEKVKDLVDQFRELGPQFHVETLDVEEEGFSEKLAKLTDGAKPLRDAIDQAAENSVFFYADGKVQRLGFHDVYQLDKQASQQANDGRGNLVLLSQGVGPFARKILNIDEKRPRVAVGVIHEILSLEGPNEPGDNYGLRGVKKTLAAEGLDGRDIILKKWSEFTGPEPAVLTYDESKYERLDEQLTEADATLKGLEQNQKELRSVMDLWQSASLDDLTKKYADQLEGQRVTEPLRKRQLALLQQNLVIVELMLGGQREERDELAKERAGLNVESLMEQRRIADLKAKTERMLADCDLLILPRWTLLNAARGEAIPNRLYRLDDAQVAAIKDFLKAGKPILALFGPPNESPNRMMDSLGTGPDKLEQLFTDLGFKLPKQTVLFNVESKSFAERRGNLMIMGTNVEVPPVQFDWPAGAGQTLAQEARAEALSPNPVRESMRLMARGLGKGQSLELKIRNPRPVYFEPAKGTTLAFDPVFMMTDPACWNEDQPFPSRERTPRFEPKADDPAKGTVEAKRRGPFPIAAAAEVSLPAAWYTDKDAKPAKVRLAAIGQGGLFVENVLPPVKEKLFLDVCNWLLGRDDLLTKEEAHWEFPRVVLADNQQQMWEWGTRLGLPLLFAYLGFVVLLVRRLR